MPNWNDLRIDSERLQHDFNALAEIGSTGDGGVNRPTFSPAHLAAREWFRQQASAADLAVQVDSAGNHSAKLPAANLNAPTLLLGSHLDSVPNGGRFDGALGVLCALEVLRTVKAAGLKLPVHLEAIDFTDEESTLVALLGSRALAGRLTAAELQHPRGEREALLAGLARAELTEAGLVQASRPPASLAGYLEVHIEQGDRLRDADAQIGIVSALVGIRSLALTFTGQADHAGTTAMDQRRDAGLGAAAFMLVANEHIRQHYPGAVMNVGRVQVQPGVLNIVPAQAELGVEFRAESGARLDAMQADLLALAKKAAQQYQLKGQAQLQAAVPAAPCAPSVQTAFAHAAEHLGLRHHTLLSYAGHDAMSLVEICPAGMIFIPSSGGSHNPNEFAEWADCVNGANTLLQAALHMAYA